jgi:hypothetical protein
MAAVDFRKRADQNVQSLLGKLAAVNGKHFPKLVVVMTKPVESRELATQDESISISFRMARDAIGFELQNRTESPIKIDWDQVSFVETTGTAVRVLHSGVRLIAKDSPQASTVVPPGAKITDQITPISRIEYEGGWSVLPLLPEKIPEMRAACGKTFRVFMPLDIGSKIKNNSFEFSVDCE